MTPVKAPEFILFDLDETLYPSSNGLMSLIRDRIVEYMVVRLGWARDEAEERRQRYVSEYGVTLDGLQKLHGVDVDDYMEYVHAVPHSKYIQPNPALDGMLGRLRPSKAIFTNASQSHARRVLSALGVSTSHFECIFDFEAAGYCPKPDPEAYRRILARLGARGDQCMLVEDNLRNLQTAKSMFGMTTVLVNKRGCGAKGQADTTIQADPPTQADTPTWAGAAEPSTPMQSDSTQADLVIDDILQLEQALANLCPVGQGFRGSCVNRHRVVEKGVP
ncbi:MAG: Phosphoglycolate phosphatase [Firmicutes bacterium ADurb.BinA052]|nr:MAG: Phosphoglycolate phosphatase [Firmicutes bacterium ADurb.BinA052]